MPHDRIQDRARGRWASILPLLGIDATFLNGKHTGCPMCGGKDRWRWIDRQGSGDWICTHCGHGDGIELAKRFLAVDFLAAVRLVEKHIGSAPLLRPKTRSERERAEVSKDQLQALWGRAMPLTGEDLASRYLINRGIRLPAWPTCLRFIEELPWKGEDGSRAVFPAMLAKYVAPDGKSATLHRTWLAEPGVEADVPQPRKLMPGRVTPGSAVRLAAAAETMGIGEGIETALSAMILYNVPVWAAVSAGALVKWKPPESAKCILIFGDNDRNFAGQNAAYSLAFQLAAVEKLHVEVRLPEEVGDWNDVLTLPKAAGRRSRSMSRETAMKLLD